MQVSKRARRYLALCFLLVSLGYFAMCNYVAQGLVTNRLSKAPPMPAEFEAAATRLTNSPIWVSKNINSAKVVFVFAHGLKGNRAHWSTAARSMIAAGFGAVIVALPGHDAHPDPITSLGPKESAAVTDSVGWVRVHCKSRPKVVLVGVSMGAAACWLVLASAAGSVSPARAASH